MFSINGHAIQTVSLIAGLVLGVHVGVIGAILLEAWALARLTKLRRKLADQEHFRRGLDGGEKPRPWVLNSV